MLSLDVPSNFIRMILYCSISMASNDSWPSKYGSEEIKNHLTLCNIVAEVYISWRFSFSMKTIYCRVSAKSE